MIQQRLGWLGKGGMGLERVRVYDIDFGYDMSHSIWLLIELKHMLA